MKRDGRTYRIIWDAHAWAGAIASILLVTMFLLGVVTMFHDELQPWEEPRLRAPVVVDEATTLATVQRALNERAVPGAPKRIEVDLPSERAPWVRLSWRDDKRESFSEWLHPVTGEIAPARSELGEFLFLMHFLYPLPKGMLSAGLLSVLLLAVVLSGLFLQLGKFGRELLRFRPAEALRTVWSDLHKVLGSVGLPYQAMIAWTAAIVCLNAMVLQPVVVQTAFDGDVDAGLAAIGYPRGPKQEKVQAAAPDVAKVLATARKALPTADHYRLSVRLLGDAASHVDVRGQGREGLAEFTTVRVAADGTLLHTRRAGGPGIASKILEGAYVLHSGKSSGFGMRLAYALMGLFSVVCVITGNLIWLERKALSRQFFDVLLARLTSGGCAAATVSLAAIFVANQLLPDTLQQRIEWERWIFYGAWALTVIVALADPRPVRSARVLIGLSGMTFLALPPLDAWRNGRTPLNLAGSEYLFWTDVALLAFGALLLLATWSIGKLAPRSATAPAAVAASSPAVALSSSVGESLNHVG